MNESETKHGASDAKLVVEKQFEPQMHTDRRRCEGRSFMSEGVFEPGFQVQSSGRLIWAVKTKLFPRHSIPRRPPMGYLILATIAAAGFLASLVCHIMSWTNNQPALGRSVFLLHAGIFAVWIPLVIFANRTMPRPGGGNLEHLLAELPKWLRRALSCLFVYAVLNFVYFIFCTQKYPKHGVPFSLELRGFSGHWMMFYGMAAAGFVALAVRLKRRRENEFPYGLISSCIALRRTSRRE